MDLPKIIRQSPLFAGSTDEDIAAILRICKVREYERGEVLFDEGDVAQGFYIVAAGRVKVYKLSPEGKERILHVLQPGGNFAEAAIFADGRYPASAEPLEKSTLIFFPKRDFLDLLAEQGRIAINMIGGLSRFLRLFAGSVSKNLPSVMFPRDWLATSWISVMSKTVRLSCQLPNRRLLRVSAR